MSKKKLKRKTMSKKKLKRKTTINFNEYNNYEPPNIVTRGKLKKTILDNYGIDDTEINQNFSEESSLYSFVNTPENTIDLSGQELFPENNEIENNEIENNEIENNNKLKNSGISKKDRYTNFCENIIPTLPKNITEDNSIKYLLHFHGGENTENISEFIIPENFYIISLERPGLIYNSTILSYLFLKIGMLNNISNKLFKNITEEILFTESKLIDKKYKKKNILEEKHFRLYYPKSKFYNYKIATDEKIILILVYLLFQLNHIMLIQNLVIL